MKALVGAFNQEKALVGAFSVIVQLHRLIYLKVVTDTVVTTTTTTTTTEEKYRVLAPESMQETFMSDSEDEGGKSVNG